MRQRLLCLITALLIIVPVFSMLAPQAASAAPSSSSTSATSYCQGTSVPKDLSDCITIYNAGSNGTGSSASSYCTSNPAGTISETDCENIYQQGQNSASSTNSSDTATCEDSGFNFSWVFCSIVDGMANAANDVYQDIVQPLLATKPIDLSPSNGTFKTWSDFRIYGDVVLVIVLLVIVFGESIGGGVIDAYTAKKVLPRLLAAAILINLSIYIVAFSVDVSNILGAGLESLLEQPFKSAGTFHLSVSGADGGLGIIALLGAAGLIWHLKLAGSFLEILGFCVVLPAVLTMIAILVTVLFRQGLILFLIFVSPVAFALYCLPNTEQYFKKWWDLLMKTLLVYPIISVVFAMGNILSVTIGSTSSGLIGKTLGDLVGLVAMFVPLVMIPYSFRLAGGALAQAHQAVTGGRDRLHKATENRRQRAMGNFRRDTVQGRQNSYASLQGRASKYGEKSVRGRALRMAANRMGGYDIEGKTAAVRAEEAKKINDTIATGKDDEIRGLTVNKKWADSFGAVRGIGDNNGHARVVDDGNGHAIKQYKSLGGQWVNEADVDAGHKRWGNNTFAQQAALSYEMRKASDEGQLEQLGTNFSSVAQGPGGWGMTDQQAGGAWIGAAFENQNQHLEYKYTNWKNGQIDETQGGKGKGFVDEIYEKKGSYQLSQMSSHTIKRLKDSYTQAQAAGDTDTQQKIAAISETFMHQMGSGGVAGMTAGDNPQPIMGGGSGGRQANTPGAGHVAERVYELANMVSSRPEIVAAPLAPGAAGPVGPPSVYGAAPSGDYSAAHRAKTPTDNQRGQS